MIHITQSVINISLEASCASNILYLIIFIIDFRQLLPTCLISIGVTQFIVGNNTPFHSAIECEFSMWSSAKIEESSTIEAVQMIDNILIR